MTVTVTLAVVRRVLRQLRRDPRSLVLVFGVPLLLLWLLKEVFSQSPAVFDRVAPQLLGLFPFLVMFLLTTIAVLRERTQGTLDRLMASPIGRGDLLVGYAVAYGLLALAQGAVAVGFALGVLDVPNNGNLALTFFLVILQALLGVSLGLFLSAFARTEFQAVQFLPAVVLPQFLMAGLFAPVDDLPRGLELIARVMPLTYAFELLTSVMLAGEGLDDGTVARDFTIIAGGIALLLAAGALTLRRSEP